MVSLWDCDFISNLIPFFFFYFFQMLLSSFRWIRRIHRFCLKSMGNDNKSTEYRKNTQPIIIIIITFGIATKKWIFSPGETFSFRCCVKSPKISPKSTLPHHKDYFQHQHLSFQVNHFSTITWNSFPLKFPFFSLIN